MTKKNMTLQLHSWSYLETFFKETYAGSRSFTGNWWHSDLFTRGSDFCECWVNDSQFLGKGDHRRSYNWSDNI